MKSIRPSHYTINAEEGVVYGRSGMPIRKIGNGGYIETYGDRGRYSGMAHRLIWESVHGEIPKGMHINHINGIKTDNRIANLELVTPSENVKHAYRIGLKSAKGMNNGRAIGKLRARAAIAAATGEAK